MWTNANRKKAGGKTSMEAMRCLKRRLSDIVYRHLVDDAFTAIMTSPGGQRGNDSDSSATGSRPHTGSSDKPLPGPAQNQAYDRPPSRVLTQRGARSGRVRDAAGGSCLWSGRLGLNESPLA